MFFKVLNHQIDSYLETAKVHETMFSLQIKGMWSHIFILYSISNCDQLNSCESCDYWESTEWMIILIQGHMKYESTMIQGHITYEWMWVMISVN